MSNDRRDEAMRDLRGVSDRLEAMAAGLTDSPTETVALAKAVGALAREVVLLSQVLEADLGGRLDP